MYFVQRTHNKKVLFGNKKITGTIYIILGNRNTKKVWWTRGTEENHTFLVTACKSTNNNEVLINYFKPAVHTSEIKHITFSMVLLFIATEINSEIFCKK